MPVLERGSRLLVSLIDEIAAQDPDRLWGVVPVDDNDLSRGFKDITYGTLSNAINHAASWLQRNLPSDIALFETIAYSGPKDIRYAIIAVAAAKVQVKLLLPSPFASVAAQAHLLKISGCKSYLYAAPLKPMVEEVYSFVGTDGPILKQIPDVSALLDTTKAATVAYTKSWDEASKDPWLIFHTSGTTGFPKLVIYTHQMMASLDRAELMPDANEDNINHYFEYRRWYTPLPSLHFVGMTVTLQFSVFFGAVVVIGPVTPGLTTPLIAKDVIRHGKVGSVMFPPALIDGLCREEEGLQLLRQLDHLYFAGAPLMRATAEKLIGHVMPKPAMGSTEAGAYFLRDTGEEDWEYYSFRPAMGFEFRHVTGDLYEPVFVKQPSMQKWQQVFEVYPELQEFHTKDLFSQHPSKPGFWKYVGRTDDLIAFSHGENLYASGVEEVIMQHPDVTAALAGGQGRPRPFVIVECKDVTADKKTMLDTIWPVIESANERCSDLVKIRKELVLFAGPGKTLVRNAKGSVARRESEKLYAAEIDDLYSKLE